MTVRLEQAIGHVFANAGLRETLTHRNGFPHNERLEFLGDSILNGVIARALYERFPELPEVICLGFVQIWYVRIPASTSVWSVAW